MGLKSFWRKSVGHLRISLPFPITMGDLDEFFGAGFDAADVNKNGELTFAEAKPKLTQLLKMKLESEPTDEMIEGAWKLMDFKLVDGKIDADGKVTRDEFIAFCKKLMEK